MHNTGEAGDGDIDLSLRETEKNVSSESVAEIFPTERLPSEERMTTPVPTDFEIELTERPSEEIGKQCLASATYYNDGDLVPSQSACKHNCSCANGSVHCDMIACPNAPPSYLGCTKIETVDKCCPHYECRKFSLKLNYNIFFYCTRTSLKH